MPSLFVGRLKIKLSIWYHIYTCATPTYREGESSKQVVSPNDIKFCGGRGGYDTFTMHRSLVDIVGYHSIELFHHLIILVNFFYFTLYLCRTRPELLLPHYENIWLVLIFTLTSCSPPSDTVYTVNCLFFRAKVLKKSD